MTTKIVRLGTLKTYGGRSYSVYCKIEFKNGNLSITGVEGPLSSGNCLGGCGQIIMDFKEYDNRGYMSIRDINLAPAWNRAMIKKFFDLWDRWHLNDLHAECEHQRGFGWTYDTHKGQKCPVCDYQIGTSWKREEVPQDVIDWLFSLPDADRQPAWV